MARLRHNVRYIESMETIVMSAFDHSYDAVHTKKNYMILLRK